MKMINCNNWAPRNRRASYAEPPYVLTTTNPPNLYYLWFYRYYYESRGLGVYIPKLDKLYVPIDSFYYRVCFFIVFTIDW